MGNFKKVISLHQASLISGYHQDYLSALIRKNEIRGEKKGGNWFTTEEEIKTYILKQKIRHKKWIAKYFLLFTKKINKSFIYAIICLALFSAGIYFYNKMEMTAQTKVTQLPTVHQPAPKEQFSELQF